MTGPTVPDDLQDITPLWLTRALSSSREPEGAFVTGYTVEPIAEGKGYMSRLYRLWLDYDAESDDAPKSIIAKLPSSDPSLKLVYKRLGQNLREVCFYRELASDVQVQTPRCYYGEKDPATGDTIPISQSTRKAQVLVGSRT